MPSTSLQGLLKSLGDPAERKRLLGSLATEHRDLAARIRSVEEAIKLLGGEPVPANGHPRAIRIPKPDVALAPPRRQHRKLRAHIERVCVNPDCPRGGKPFRAKRVNTKYCGGPCTWAHYRVRKAEAMDRGAEARRANLIRARKALAAKREEAAKEAAREAKRGHTLLPGDALSKALETRAH